MTIDKAEEKVCCKQNGCVCCADNCMAWRWFDPAIKNEGYCGLAGKEGAE